MTSASPLSSTSSRLTGSLASTWGWVYSIGLHAALVFLLLTTGLPSCASLGDVAGNEGGDFRHVGLQVKRPPTERPDWDRPEDAAADAPQALAADSVLRPPTEVLNKPPVPLSLPESTVMRIGPGGSAPPPLPGDALPDMIRPTGTPRIGGASGVGPGEVQFFGAKDQATQVVYVLDRSGSMAGDPIREAKARLIASLEGLDKTQRFQVIFYNQTPMAMTLRGERTPELYWATDINRTLARQFISGIQADDGTRHIPALELALSMSPEVVYLLTDLDHKLSARDFAELRRLNRAGTHIHCIEFGERAQLTDEGNFLKRLAGEHGGTYVYQDVTQFRRP